MKIITMLVTVLILTAMLMTGCGCRNSKPMDTMPSENTTAATTMPTTEATTAPTTMPSTENTDATVDNGNGPLSTEGNGGNGGSGNNGGNGGSGSSGTNGGSDSTGNSARSGRLPGMQ